jgi:tetratricopeptide (TPR) repeat protein
MDLNRPTRGNDQPGSSWLYRQGAVLLAAGLIVVAGLAAYGNSFSGPFIYDDLSSIRDNPSIRHLSAIGEVLSPPGNGETVSGRPLLNLSFAINYAISGPSTRGYHVVNLAIHILNGLLLLGILRQTFCSSVLSPRFGRAALGLGWATAILWTVHPLQTESVTYIVQRAESLASMLYLLVLYCAIRGMHAKRPVGWYVVAVGSCWLGVATKETVVTAPLMVLLYDRTFVGGSLQEAFRRRWSLYVALAAGWMLLIGLLWSTGLVGRREEMGTLDAWSYACSQPGVLLHYLRLSVWPDPLCFNYDWPAGKTMGAILPAMTAVGLLVVATVRGLTGGRTWGFVGAWFFLILAPSSSVQPLGQLAFEHRMYLPLAAVASAVVVGGAMAGQWLARRGWLPGRAGMIAGVCVVTLAAVVLGQVTFRRNEAYGTELSIWQDTVAKAPHSSFAHNNLGVELTNSGRVAEAIEHCQEAIRLKPDNASAHANLGNALKEAGRAAEAIERYQEAIRLKPSDAQPHYNLGNALAKGGRVAEAIEHYQEAIRLKPDYASAHMNLGVLLGELGRLPEAIEHHRQALKITPDCAEAYNNLAVAMVKSDDLQGALEPFLEAVRLDPHYAEAHYNLSVTLSRVGRIREAIEHGQEAARLAPTRWQLNRFAAWLMAIHEPAQGGDPTRAVELGQQACTLTGRHESICLDTLAAAYASAGRFDEAASTAKEAWQIAQSAGQDSLAEEIHMRMQLYRDQKPYRKPVVLPASHRP